MDKHIEASINDIRNAIACLENAKANIQSATFENCSRADQLANMNYRDSDLHNIDHLLYYANQAIENLNSLK